VGEVVRHALAEIFLTEDIEDEDLRGLAITVSEVRASPDLRHVTAFVGVLGGGDNAALAKALNRHQRYLRGELARRVELKYMPEIAFKPDQAVETSEKIDALLRSPDVARDLK
jgi:ribosome-binding factor A